ncbi:hypothetical protein M409DRAFT_50241 [Zasmidium cellare ATCC 36951]|uniref:Uncharacterized protein n=1 Tax=Zasmidium cellare ATCC 36951 TaxID=1080233 RepID=A0A6A6D4J2_ZASCE|nr:uncharacterized protein M409DRAFT_50241 [Zasmidium cellare ATCC 36951]KAF2172566.1 hypothetical protein M409DRAFT_50241 [Zasmidium cellare ATCC 36951]
MDSRNDSEKAGGPLHFPAEDDLKATEGMKQTIIDAKKASDNEQSMTLIQGLKLYPKAIAWSILISTCIANVEDHMINRNNMCNSCKGWRRHFCHSTPPPNTASASTPPSDHSTPPLHITATHTSNVTGQHCDQTPDNRTQLPDIAATDLSGLSEAAPAKFAVLAVMAPSAGAKDPKDPTGHPFRLKSDGKLKGVPFKKGEVGVVEHFKAATNEVIVKFPRRYEENPNRPRQEWQPTIVLHSDHMEVNWKVKWGETKVNADIQTAIDNVNWDDGVQFRKDEHNLTIMAYRLLNVICDAKYHGNLAWLGACICRKFPNPGALLDWCRELTKAAEAARSADAFKFQNPWHVPDYVRLGKQVNGASGGKGLYLKMYSGFKKMYVGQKPKWYVGKTIRHFGVRHTEHEYSTTSPKDRHYNSLHYRTARDAKYRVTIELLRFDGTKLGDDDKDYDVAENVMICLLRTYRSDVLDAHFDVASSESTGSDENVMADEIETREAAMQLNEIATKSPLQAVSQATYERLLYIHIDAGDRDTFTRTRSTVAKGVKNQKNVTYICIAGLDKNNKAGDNLRFVQNPKDDGPNLKDKVSMTFEIMKNGRHPQAYGCLPDVLGLTNDEDLHKFAARIEWEKEDGDEWWRQYLQYDIMGFNLKDDKVPASMSRVWEIMALRMYLQQQSFDKLFSWQHPRIGTARVKTATFDPWSQEYQLAGYRGGGIIKQPTIDHSRTKKRLESFGLENYGRQWDGKPFFKNDRPGQPRTACDTCFVGKAGGGGTGTAAAKCQKAEHGTGECQTCYYFGRKCTYTPTRKIESIGISRCRQILYSYQPHPDALPAEVSWGQYKIHHQPSTTPHLPTLHTLDDCTNFRQLHNSQRLHNSRHFTPSTTAPTLDNFITTLTDFITTFDDFIRPFGL